jgi:hypothetical protein
MQQVHFGKGKKPQRINVFKMESCFHEPAK